MTDAIRIHDLTISFGPQKVYEKLSLSVHAGEFLCVVGPSGCGKSTLLRVIGGLLGTGSDNVRIHGESPATAWRRLAYVFQSPRLVGWRNARDNVLLAAQLRQTGQAAHALRARAEALLAMVGLGQDGDKYPQQLSGGERQRVSIARALLVDPDIILMDEPFSALDIGTRQKLRAQLVDIWETTRKTIIFVTHDISEAVQLADRVVVLSSRPASVVQTFRIASPRADRPIDSPRISGLIEQISALMIHGDRTVTPP